MSKAFVIFFLLLSCIAVKVHAEVVSEDYVIAEKKFLEAQKELFYQTIVEMHKNGQMTKENVDALAQKLGIEDFKKIMEERKQTYVEIGMSGLTYGAVAMLSVYVSKFHFHCFQKDSPQKMLDRRPFTTVLNFLNAGKTDAQKKRFMESLPNLFDKVFYCVSGTFSVLGLMGIGFGLNGLCKVYVSEQRRRQEALMIDEIVKELDRVQIA